MRCDEIDWIEKVERKTGHALPPSFRSLVSRYVFPAFELEKVALCANTKERTPTWCEFRNWATNRDFWGPLLDASYVPFARVNLSIIDPVCFDTHAVSDDGEYRLVRFYHEEVWMDNRVRVDEEIADSFSEVLRNEVEGNGP